MNEDTTRGMPDDASGRSAEPERHTASPGDPMASAEQTLADAASEIGDSAAEAARAARDKAEDLAEEGKAAGANRMQGFARAARKAAEDLEGESPEIARYVRQAADGLQNAASSVRSRSVGEIMDMVEDFARRQPTAYFGSTVLAGFMLSRFMKSRSGRTRHNSSTRPSGETSEPRERSRAGSAAGTPFRTRDNLPSTPSSIGEMP
jgi:hypothetical protein